LEQLLFKCFDLLEQSNPAGFNKKLTDKPCTLSVQQPQNIKDGICVTDSGRAVGDAGAGIQTHKVV